MGSWRSFLCVKTKKGADMNELIFVKSTNGRLKVDTVNLKLYLDDKEVKSKYVDLTTFIGKGFEKVDTLSVVGLVVFNLTIPLTKIDKVEVVSIDGKIDLRFTEPIESIDAPGFYHNPIETNLLVNKQGFVIDCISLKPTSFKERPLPNNYVRANGILVHRLMMYSFSNKFILDLKILIPNHLNGVKNDNRLENLEWTTRTGNLEHAYNFGLRLDNGLVELKDYLKDEILEFRSGAEAARYVNISTNGRDSEQTLLNRLKSNDVRLVRKRFAIRRKGSGVEFISDIKELYQGLQKVIIVKDVVTGEEFECDSSEEFKDFFESKGIFVKVANLFFYLEFQARKKCIRRPLNKYVFKRNTEPFEFPVLTELEKKYYSRCHEIKILRDIDYFGVCVLQDGKPVDAFANISQAAYYLGLTNNIVFNAFHVARNRGKVIVYTEEYGYITFDRLYKDRFTYSLNVVSPSSESC